MNKLKQKYCTLTSILYTCFTESLKAAAKIANVHDVWIHSLQFFSPDGNTLTVTTSLEDERIAWTIHIWGHAVGLTIGFSFIFWYVEK